MPFKMTWHREQLPAKSSWRSMRTVGRTGHGTRAFWRVTTGELVFDNARGVVRVFASQFIGRTGTPVGIVVGSFTMIRNGMEYKRGFEADTAHPPVLSRWARQWYKLEKARHGWR